MLAWRVSGEDTVSTKMNGAGPVSFTIRKRTTPNCLEDAVWSPRHISATPHTACNLTAAGSSDVLQKLVRSGKERGGAKQVERLKESHHEGRERWTVSGEARALEKSLQRFYHAGLDAVCTIFLEPICQTIGQICTGQSSISIQKTPVGAGQTSQGSFDW